LESKADELNLVMSTSETHNRANLRMGREQSFAALAEVVRHVDGRTPINVSLSTAFGCPMEGDVPEAEVVQFAERFAKANSYCKEGNQHRTDWQVREVTNGASI
jgi:hydroxymethylglutaryl-CoA lyase